MASKYGVDTMATWDLHTPVEELPIKVRAGRQLQAPKSSQMDNAED